MRVTKSLLTFAAFDSLLLWLAGVSMLIDLGLALATYAMLRGYFLGSRRGLVQAHAG
jgi:hypothetical protein